MSAERNLQVRADTVDHRIRSEIIMIYVDNVLKRNVNKELEITRICVMISCDAEKKLISIINVEHKFHYSALISPRRIINER